MDTELWVYFHEQMHMVWHNFHLNDVDAIFITDFFYEGFQPYINAIDQDLTAVFWTPNHMIFAGVHHIVVALILYRQHYTTVPYIMQDDTLANEGIRCALYSHA